MKRIHMPIIAFLFFSLFSGCITYRQDGIKFPVIRDNTVQDEGGWEIHSGDAMETELLRGYKIYFKYLAINLSATNKSGKKRKFKYWVHKYDESNLRYMIGKSIIFRIAYSLNPDSYDTKDFYEEKGLEISYRRPGDEKRRVQHCSGIPESYFWGILRSTRTRSYTSDWISSGSTHNVTVYCGIADDATDFELSYYGHKIASYGQAAYAESVKQSLKLDR